MVKKKIFFFIMLYIFIILFPTAFAIDTLCTETRQNGQNCTVLTAALDCTTYDYQIINMSGDVVDTTNLTPLYDDIYYLNFSLPNGEYVIRLCDGSTKEINFTDEEGNNMIAAIIILLPMILAFLAIYAASTMDKEHSALKIFFFVFSFILFILSLHFALMSIIHFYNWPEMQDMIGTTTYWYALIILLLIFYVVIMIILNAISLARQKKDVEIKY